MRWTALFLRLALRQLAGTTRTFGRHSKLKIAVLALFALLFWAGLFSLFYQGLKFIEGRVPADLASLITNYLFSLFFFSLLLMLGFSNGIIGYTGLFRSRESEFLLTQPVPAGAVFLYKLTESLLFSSWAFLFIGAPILLAFGLLRGAPWGYYPITLALFAPFTLLPAALGNGLALAVVRWLPRSGRLVLLLLALALTLAGWAVGRSLYQVSQAHSLFSSIGLYQVFSRLEFLHNPLLPSYWMNQGVLLAAKGEYARTGFYFLLLSANGLFFLWLATLLAHRHVERAYDLAHSHGAGARRYVRRFVRRALDATLFFLPPRTRVFLEKDLKSFFRDPVQWSQFLLLFGLLAFYILNLRTLNYDDKNLFWKNIISFLNLGATALTMSTFSSRFVFPLLSLEGRRFWVLGVSPLEKGQILVGKLAFSLLGLLVVSETLIAVSCWMLAVPLAMALVHCLTMVAICVGISGLAVGLGAMYPDFREDNPSKIVAGFGGTLNLVLSLLFILLVVAILAVPCHVYFVRGGRAGLLWLAVPLALTGALSLAVCVVPLRLGLAAFRRLEI